MGGIPIHTEITVHKYYWIIEFFNIWILCNVSGLKAILLLLEVAHVAFIFSLSYLVFVIYLSIYHLMEVNCIKKSL